MKKKVLLALDISTTTVGVALFDMHTKELIHINYVNVLEDCHPEYDEELFGRMYVLADYIQGLSENYNIHHIAVEEALKGSINPYTAQRLYGFNLLVRYWLFVRFGIEATTIDIHTIRKTILTDYVNEKGKLSIPKGESVKHLIWEVVNEKYPHIKWDYNKNGKLHKHNYDMSDAYAVGMTYFKITENKQ